MRVKNHKLASLIADQTLKTGITKSLSDQIAKIVVKSNQTTNLNSIMRDVMSEWAKRGFLEVIARSCFPINVQTKREITSLMKKNYPEAKAISIVEIIDPSVIAGVKIELADKQLDLTVKTKINKLKQFAAS